MGEYQQREIVRLRDDLKKAEAKAERLEVEIKELQREASKVGACLTSPPPSERRSSW